ncbi:MULTISPECIES: DUF4314 domain-containing protein [unclassified Nonomuraea]|uniref:DUF4314 domain-containing protein n=1 Tax=unclassified Nonomuraea TaxID=2593643 RepID=UPI0033C58F6A
MPDTFQPGDRVELIATSDPYTRLVPGQQGTVIHVDSGGGIAIHWDCGSILGMLPGQGDEIRHITRSVPPPAMDQPDTAPQAPPTDDSQQP